MKGWGKRSSIRAAQRRGESGQTIPIVAMAILVAAFLAVLVVKVTLDHYRQTRLETGIDATAMAAGTAYARGMNVTAVFNQLLIPAAIVDAVAHCWIPPVPTRCQGTLLDLQDMWVEKVAPVMMELLSLIHI